MTTVAERGGLVETIDQVTAELARWQVPGAELVVVHGGETLYAGGVGVRGVADDAPVGARTLFHHGSCGKAYTGLLASVLAESGELDLDDPVVRHVPELSLPDPVVAQGVTMRDLLSHRSGLGRHDMVWILDAALTRTELVARLAHLPMIGALRSQWAYSNLGYTLAGHVIERATATSWEEQLADRVLRPLGMTRTFTSAETADADADHATAHVSRDGAAQETVWQPYVPIAPAGGVISCAEDSVRWLLAQLGETHALPIAAIKQAHELTIALPAGASPFPELEFAGYGFGWISGSYRGHALIWHNGGVDGFTTQTLLLPDDGIGVLVSANQHLTDFSLAAMLTLADAVLGTAGEVTWFERLRDAKDDEPSDSAEPHPDPTPAPPSQSLTAYPGTFRDAGYGECRVTAADARLQIRLCGSDVAASHQSLDTWMLHYVPLDERFPATFHAGADGEIMHIEVEFEPAQPIRFVRDPEATR